MSEILFKENAVLKLPIKSGCLEKSQKSFSNRNITVDG